MNEETSTPAIVVDLPAEGVAGITFNRPRHLNSFTMAMLEELCAALDNCAVDPAIRAVLITGEGKAFSAGQDLKDPDFLKPGHLDGSEPESGKDIAKRVVAEHYNPVIERIVTMEKPVIAAVNGVAAGAGANIALACDMVVAAKGASFLQAFAKIGLVPDCGGTWYLPRLVGRARAIGMSFLAEPLSAEKAEDWGLVWRVVEDDQLKNETISLAAYLATQPTKALAGIKKAIIASETAELADQLELECKLQAEAIDSSDFKEGVRAFVEKRQPNFTGR